MARGRSPGAGGSPRGTSPRAVPGPHRAHFLRGGAPRPAPGRPGRVRGRRWLAAPASSFTAPSCLECRRFPGPWTKCSLCPLSQLPITSPRRGVGVGGTGPPRPRRDCRPERTVLSAPRLRRAAQGGDRLTYKRCKGSAAMSATHPTRLETRTKESNARASQRARSKPRGAMKVRAGARRLRWDPGPHGAPGRTTGPSRPLCRGGGA